MTHAHGMADDLTDSVSVGSNESSGPTDADAEADDTSDNVSMNSDGATVSNGRDHYSPDVVPVSNAREHYSPDGDDDLNKHRKLENVAKLESNVAIITPTSEQLAVN